MKNDSSKVLRSPNNSCENWENVHIAGRAKLYSFKSYCKLVLILTFISTVMLSHRGCGGQQGFDIDFGRNQLIFKLFIVWRLDCS